MSAPVMAAAMRGKSGMPATDYRPWRVQWRWQRHGSTTTFGSEASARAFAADLRRRGVRTVVCWPLIDDVRDALKGGVL